MTRIRSAAASGFCSEKRVAACFVVLQRAALFATWVVAGGGATGSSISNENVASIEAAIQESPKPLRRKMFVEVTGGADLELEEEDDVERSREFSTTRTHSMPATAPGLREFDDEQHQRERRTNPKGSRGKTDDIWDQHDEKEPEAEYTRTSLDEVEANGNRRKTFSADRPRPPAVSIVANLYRQAVDRATKNEDSKAFFNFDHIHKNVATQDLPPNAFHDMNDVEFLNNFQSLEQEKKWREWMMGKLSDAERAEMVMRKLGLVWLTCALWSASILFFLYLVATSLPEFCAENRELVKVFHNVWGLA